jgi:hypothetical protein
VVSPGHIGNNVILQLTPTSAHATVFSANRRNEMGRSFSARCSHVTRRLNADESLTGKVLETALEVIENGRRGFSDGDFLDEIARKLTAGEVLGDYEYHIMVDVMLLHARLGQ